LVFLTLPERVWHMGRTTIQHLGALAAIGLARRQIPNTASTQPAPLQNPPRNPDTGLALIALVKLDHHNHGGFLRGAGRCSENPTDLNLAASGSG